MLGYHDNDRCNFDLWSPVDVKTKDGSVWNKHNAQHEVQHLPTDYYDVEHRGPMSYSAVENRAFSPFCKHSQEVMDVANMICNGGTSFELDDDWDQSDLDELNRILRQRGIEASFSLTQRTLNIFLLIFYKK